MNTAFCPALKMIIKNKKKEKKIFAASGFLPDAANKPLPRQRLPLTRQRMTAEGGKQQSSKRGKAETRAVIEARENWDETVEIKCQIRRRKRGDLPALYKCSNVRKRGGERRGDREEGSVEEIEEAEEARERRSKIKKREKRKQSGEIFWKNTETLKPNRSRNLPVLIRYPFFHLRICAPLCLCHCSLLSCFGH